MAISVKDIISNNSSELLNEIMGAADNGKGYIFTDCYLSGDCNPSSVTLGMGYLKDKDKFILYISEDVLYMGENISIQELVEEKTLVFSSFDEMLSFLGSLVEVQEMIHETPQNERINEDAFVSVKSVRTMPHTDNESIDFTPADEIQHNIIVSPKEIEVELKKTVHGQDNAIRAISFMLSNFLGKYVMKRPLSLFCYGPTGCGKTELAKALSDAINAFSIDDQKYEYEVIDMARFEEKHSVYELIGAPPSYAGYGDAVVFDKVEDNPRQIFIFDEVEKAHPDVLKAIMRALDEGKHSKGGSARNGKSYYDLTKCIMIFTSNVKINNTVEMENTDVNDDKKMRVNIIKNNEIARNSLIRQDYLPEIVGRFKGFIPFEALTGNALVEIAVKAIGECALEYNLGVNHISKQIVRGILDNYTSSSGARVFYTLADVYLGPYMCQLAPNNQGKVVNIEGTLEDVKIELSN